jgi:hypothetical protein
MAKALVLSEETLSTPVPQPRAAQVATAPHLAPEPKMKKLPKAPLVPVQIRISAKDAKAIKHAALEADQTISEFMLACFHACMKR